MIPVHSLQNSNRQWKRLPPEVTRQIRNWRFAHPTALMIKELRFTRLPEQNPTGWGVYRPARLQVEVSGSRTRRYRIADFGDAEYDRYQIDSDNASRIVLGRVTGTERWGHQQ